MTPFHALAQSSSGRDSPPPNLPHIKPKASLRLDVGRAREGGSPTLSASIQWGLLALLAICSVALVAPAHAHATIEARDAKTGAPIRAAVKIPHGCKGSPTVSVAVEIPEGLIGVKPQPKPGWEITAVKGAYTKTYPYHGKSLTEGVRTLTWTGGPLLDEHFDEFVFQGFLAEAPASGIIYVPVRQRCEAGETYWGETPGADQNPHDLAAPAPIIKVAGADAPAVETRPETTQIGTLLIEAPWTRATPGGAKVGAGYLRITNTGTEPDRLISGNFVAADRVEIHEMREAEGGVMQMRQLADGLALPAGASVELKPGGTHLMLMGLREQLKDGATAVIKLDFAKAGSADLTFAVRSIGAKPDAPPSTHHHH